MKSVLKYLGSMYFAVVIILILAIVLGWATFVDRQYGSDASFFAIYHAWWFLMLCGALGLSVLVSTLVRLPWKRHQTGFLITHLGILVLMVGCWMTFQFGKNGQLGIYEGTANSVATLDSQHFELKIIPNDKTPATIIKLPFNPGPFSWNLYGTNLLTVGNSEKLPLFPWSCVPSDRSRRTLWEQDGVKLEVLDFCASARPATSEDDKSNSFDFQGLRMTSVPLSGLKSAQKSYPFAKVRLTADSCTYEGWLRFYTRDPLGTPMMDGEFYSLAGTDRSVRIAAVTDTVDVGFVPKLVRFNCRLDPGTSMKSGYSSDLEVVTATGNTEKVHITMNQPVDIKDKNQNRVWRVFQSSYAGPFTPADDTFSRAVPSSDMREQLYLSWFTVNSSPGRGLLYLGCLLITLGIAIMYSMKAYFFGKIAKVGCLLLACTFAAPAIAQDSFDLSELQTLPVLHSGRIMPLESFARLQVKQICGRVHPRISLNGAEIEKFCTKEKAADVREHLAISETQSRTWGATEILFSWIVEPQRWDVVPFLQVENEELRTLLKLPIFDANGRRLSKASPAQAAAFFESPGYQKFLEEAESARNARPDHSYPPEKRVLIETFMQFQSQFFLFRELTFRPADYYPSNTFSTNAMQLAQLWGMTGLETYVRQLDSTQQNAEDISLALKVLVQATRSGSVGEIKFQFQDYAKVTAKLVKSADALEAKVAEYVDAQIRSKYVSAEIRILMATVREFTIQTHVLRDSLYQDGTTLNLLPALESAPLDIRRSENLPLSPWMSWGALFYGTSDDVFSDFPTSARPKIKRTQDAFGEMAKSWEANQPKQFKDACHRFAVGLKSLAQDTQEIRAIILPVDRLDSDVLRATRYPTNFDKLSLEVDYYRLNFFLWSWVLPCVGMLILGLGGIFNSVFKKENALGKTCFRFGFLLLCLGILAITLGLGMRSWIMGRAPVTNMFETIVFVAWTAGIIGIWFTFRHGINHWLKIGWKLISFRNMIPVSPFRYVFWLLRAAGMACVFYVGTMMNLGAGAGYNAVHLLPPVVLGAALPTLSDTVVWLTGMILLGVLMWWVPKFVLAPFAGVASLLPSCRNSKPDASASHRTLYAFATAFVVFVISFLAFAFPSKFDPDLRNLMPVLRDNYWLAIHVITIVASYGAGMLAWMIANIALGFYAFGRYKRSESGDSQPPALCGTLSELIYRCMQAAILLLVVGTILGGLWADVSWGKFWSWDRKEVWALISLLVYLIIVHGRYVRFLGEFTLAIGAVLGAFAIVMAWYGVNFILGSALHGYGSGMGGLLPCLIISSANLGLIVAAVVRYSAQAGAKKPENWLEKVGN